VVDDSYNANPDSMRAAIDVLAELPAPRLLVLGDMGEVGDQGPQFHAEAGAHARAAGVASSGCMRWACSRPTPPRRSAPQGILTTWHRCKRRCGEALPQVGSVLVKGSRFMKMEQVVEGIDLHRASRRCGAGGRPWHDALKPVEVHHADVADPMAARPVARAGLFARVPVPHAACRAWVR
jgi:hypothetical protein